jgi:ketosteroid isomerase-like protein
MRLSRFGVIIIIVCLLGAGAAIALVAQENRSAQKAKIGIERLHQQDVAATLSGKADDLAQLWDNDAVRIQPGRPAEISKAVIVANDKRWEANGGGPTLCYKAEIKDLQIVGDWAFEWGYFSYKENAHDKPMRGKVSRVMKRQQDGSWKFARVMGYPEKLESAAPMSNPCE